MANRIRLKKAVRINEYDQIMLSHFHTFNQSLALARILRQNGVGQPLASCISLRFLMHQLNDALNLFDRSVCGSVIDDNDLQLVHRIILVDTA
ncbi:hypothetical protein D3C78_1089150 [compost metagenome]